MPIVALPTEFAELEADYGLQVPIRNITKLYHFRLVNSKTRNQMRMKVHEPGTLIGSQTTESLTFWLGKGLRGQFQLRVDPENYFV